MEDIIIRPSGMVELVITWQDGTKQILDLRNRVLRTGRMAIVSGLANDFGAAFEYFITSVSFGSGGTVGGTPRYIDEAREGLFGPVVATKPVISSINPDIPTQVTFTSVLAFDEAVGDVINEMALKFFNGDCFSMVTFGDITKTSSMQITYNWKINVL